MKDKLGNKIEYVDNIFYDSNREIHFYFCKTKFLTIKNDTCYFYKNDFFDFDLFKPFYSRRNSTIIITKRKKH